MKNCKLAIALGAALAMGTVLTATTQAMPVAQLGSQAAVPLQKAAFVFNGRNYCFYLDGWRGPGWYWCGFARRRGLGWGGPQGWHGWRGGQHPRHRRPGHVRPRSHPSSHARPSNHARPGFRSSTTGHHDSKRNHH